MPRITLSKVKINDNSTPIWRRLVELAHKRGIKVYYADIGTGVFLRTGQRHYIFLSKDMPEHERSFVLAHELGHYALHRDFPGANALFHKDSGLMDRVEMEADRFAGKLISYISKMMDAKDIKGWPEFDPPAGGGRGWKYVVTIAVGRMAA